MKLNFEKISEKAKNFEDNLNANRKFEIITGGTDAILHYNFNSEGYVPGMTVSELVLTKDGRGLLKWILSKEFPEKLNKIISIQYEDYKDRKRERVRKDKVQNYTKITKRKRSSK